MPLRDLIIFDPEEKPPETPEQKIRPSEHGVIQIQMRGMFEYEMYWAPNEMEEFDDIDLFRHRLKMMIRKWLVEEHKIQRPPDLEYETETLAERGLSLMTNYRIANIDLRDLTAVEMYTELLKRTPPSGGTVIA